MKKTKFKKFLLLLCMLTCVFSMTACTDSVSYNDTKLNQKKWVISQTDSNMKAWAQDMITYLDSTSDDNIRNDATEGITLSRKNNKQYLVDTLFLNAKTIEFYNSWIKSREDLGKLESINNIDIEENDDSGKLCTVKVNTTYEKRDCDFELIINYENSEFTFVSGAINPVYTTAERMSKAGMNTLLGMGTVFIVLIFISFIISLLKYVNKIGAKKPEASAASTQKQGIDNAIEQIVSNEESEADDYELVAVITAAIAASEGTSSNGLVVRSIKKVGRAKNWKNA